MEKKTLDIVSARDTKERVSDVKIVGDGDTFVLISKASSASQGWMKSTKAMTVAGLGVIVQVSTQQGDHVAEALVFVPGARIQRGKDGERKVREANARAQQVYEEFWGK